MLSCEFCEISKNTFYTEHVWATASKKFNLIMSTNKPVDIQLSSSIVIGNCEKMLGLKLNVGLNFDRHVKSLCSQPNNKMRVLEKATQCMSIEK